MQGSLDVPRRFREVREFRLTCFASRPDEVFDGVTNTESFPEAKGLDHIDCLQPVGQIDRKSTRLNSSHIQKSRMPSSA